MITDSNNQVISHYVYTLVILSIGLCSQVFLSYRYRSKHGKNKVHMRSKYIRFAVNRKVSEDIEVLVTLHAYSHVYLVMSMQMLHACMHDLISRRQG